MLQKPHSKGRIHCPLSDAELRALSLDSLRVMHNHLQWYKAQHDALKLDNRRIKNILIRNAKLQTHLTYIRTYARGLEQRYKHRYNTLISSIPEENQA